jgi:hypothetical protein
LAEGVAQARTTLGSGAPIKLLERLRASRAAHEAAATDDAAAVAGSAPAPAAETAPAGKSA